MQNPNPYISAAFICEKVLIENDGALSAIRIIDTLYVQKDINEAVKDTVLLQPVTLFVSLKGNSQIEGKVSIFVTTPNGESKETLKDWPVTLSGEISGANILINLAFSPRHIGITYIDVYWNQEVISRIPVRLLELDKPST